MEIKESRCWTCANACDERRCPWVAGFQPVDGWVVDVTNHRRYGEQTFVKECPLYKPDPPRDSIATILDDRGAEDLALAVVKLAINDWIALKAGYSVDDSSATTTQIELFFKKEKYKALGIGDLPVAEMFRLAQIEVDHMRKLVYTIEKQGKHNYIIRNLDTNEVIDSWHGFPFKGLEPTRAVCAKLQGVTLRNLGIMHARYSRYGVR